MKLEDIEKLIKLVTEKQLSEFHYKQGEEELTIKRAVAAVPPAFEHAPAPMFRPAPAAAPLHVPSFSETKPVAVEKAKIEEPEKGTIIRSPFVGTFYRSPAPGAKSFVNEGDYVKKGQVLCIVEAMKLMNEIEAEIEGRLKTVFAPNETPVEFGEPLFLIE